MLVGRRGLTRQKDTLNESRCPVSIGKVACCSQEANKAVNQYALAPLQQV